MIPSCVRYAARQVQLKLTMTQQTVHCCTEQQTRHSQSPLAEAVQASELRQALFQLVVAQLASGLLSIVATADCPESFESAFRYEDVVTLQASKRFTEFSAQ
eukprot:1220425-Amphidinium_carterae.1